MTLAHPDTVAKIVVGSRELGEKLERRIIERAANMGEYADEIWLQLMKGTYPLHDLQRAYNEYEALNRAERAIYHAVDQLIKELADSRQLAEYNTNLIDLVCE